MDVNNLIGAKTEYECTAKFLELGCMVSLPVSHFAILELINCLKYNVKLATR